jgi:phosphoserine phosphatase RsbU/P
VSTRSKLEALRAATIFARTPPRALAELAALLKGLELEAGAEVFAKGDIGDSLYLVASGRVRVHDGERTIDELGPGDIFGEMALLDEEARSASVSTTQPSLLFRLEQAPFYRLLEERPEVAREIIKVLSRRLRAQLQSVAENHRYIAQLYQASREAERMAHELKLASQVQSSFLPQAAPSITGWDVAAGWRPARELSGDFYDFIPLEHGLGLVIADVADKGMPAALFMALTRSVLRSSVSAARAPERSIARANRLLCADAAGGMFVTLFYGQLDPATGELHYVNAGHNPPLLFRAASGELEPLARTGIVLGWDATASFESRTVGLKSQDFVLFYTDGVTEAVTPSGEAFGDERLEAFLLKHPDLPATELVRKLQDALDGFTGGKEPSDDITLFIVKRLDGA